MDRDFDHLDLNLGLNNRKGLFYTPSGKSVENLVRTETIQGPQRVMTVKSSPNDKVPPPVTPDVTPSTNFFNAMLNVEKKSLMVDPSSVMRRPSRARISTRSEIRAASKRYSSISNDSPVMESTLDAKVSTTSLNSRSGASGRKSSVHIPSTGNSSNEKLGPILIQVPNVLDSQRNHSFLNVSIVFQHRP
jgi:hypothetical protein